MQSDADTLPQAAPNGDRAAPRCDRRAGRDGAGAAAAPRTGGAARDRVQSRPHRRASGGSRAAKRPGSRDLCAGSDRRRLPLRRQQPRAWSRLQRPGPLRVPGGRRRDPAAHGAGNGTAGRPGRPRRSQGRRPGVLQHPKLAVFACRHLPRRRSLHPRSASRRGGRDRHDVAALLAAALRRRAPAGRVCARADQLGAGRAGRSGAGACAHAIADSHR